jgi:hypothetical protein
MKTGQLGLGDLMLKNPSLGGKMLLGGADNSKVYMIIAAIVVVILIGLGVYWYMYMHDKKEQMTSSSGAFIGVGPSADTYGYGLFNVDGTESSDISHDPFGRPIRSANVDYIAGLQTAEFHKRMQDPNQKEFFDPRAVVEGRENFVEWSDRDGVVLEEAMRDNAVGRTLGIAPSVVPRENMTNNRKKNSIYGKILDLNRRSSVVPSASAAGENEWQTALFQAQAKDLFKHRRQDKNMENMADVGPLSDNVSQYLSLQNIGAGQFAPDVELFKEMKKTKRGSYEHLTNTGRVDVLPDTGVQFYNPYIGQEPAYNPYEVPSAPAIANLRARPQKKKSKLIEKFGVKPSHKTYPYPTKYTSQHTGANRGVRPSPYTTRQVQFQTAFDPEGQALAAVSELSESERRELKALTEKYSVMQLDARNLIKNLRQKKSLAAKRQDVKFTAANQQTLEELIKFVNEHGTDIDRWNELIQKSRLSLAKKQYIRPTHIPQNACRVHPGLRYYGRTGELRRKTKFVPSNSCNYMDYKNIGDGFGFVRSDFDKVQQIIHVGGVSPQQRKRFENAVIQEHERRMGRI